MKVEYRINEGWQSLSEFCFSGFLNTYFFQCYREPLCFWVDRSMASADYIPSVLLGQAVTSEPGRSRYEWRNQRSFTAIKSDGSVVSWGSVSTDGNEDVIRYTKEGPFQQVFSNRHAWAAIRSDGKLITWGNGGRGGEKRDAKDDLQDGVVRVFSTRRSFSALKSDGSVVSWGQDLEGGDNSLVAEQLTSDVVNLFSTGTSMAALKSDGSVVTWGLSTEDPRSESLGGDIDTGSPRGGDSSEVADLIDSDVVDIFSSRYAFAALKNDGSVVAWGDPLRGGDTEAQRLLRKGVQSVASTGTSFAALKKNGRVVTWGDPWRGGSKDVVDFHTYHWTLLEDESEPRIIGRVKKELRSGVTEIFSTRYAYAALKGDGSLVTWGLQKAGGDSSGVLDRLQVGVKSVASTRYAFAALLKDGSIVSWGDKDARVMDKKTRKALVNGEFVSITSSRYGFAALADDGSVFSWGSTGSAANSKYPIDTSSVEEELSGGVVEVFSTGYSFAALKDDGSVVAWGDAAKGGDTSSVRRQLASDVVTIASPFTDVSTFKLIGNEVTSIVDFDLSSDVDAADHLMLGGLARLSGKGNDRANRIVANNAGNELFGRSGADSLIGGEGDDVLRGGAGDDLMNGGRGADQFEMSKGQDLIEDFDPSEGDQIIVENADLISMTATAGGLMLTRDGGEHSLLLQGLTFNDVSGYDIFA